MADSNIKPLYKGDISKINISELLIRLGVLSENGYVEIVLQDYRVRIYLYMGDIVNIDSDSLDFSLAGFLKKKGRLNDEQYEDVKKLISLGDKGPADVLLSLGFLRPHEVIPIINEFLICSLGRIATFSKGQYIYYKIVGDVYPFVVNLRFNTVDAVKNMIFNYLPDEYFLKMFKNHTEIDIIIKNSGLGVDKARLGPKELRYLKLICNTGKFKDYLPEIAPENREHIYKLRAAYYFKICAIIELRRGNNTLESVFHIENAEENLFSECGLNRAVDTSKEKPANSTPANPDEDKKVAELNALFEDLKKKNYFDRLGIAEDANDAAVKKAYIKLAKQYHPDVVTTDASKGIKKCYEDIFALINEAYQKLERESDRKEYLASIRQSKDGKAEVDIAAILEDEAKFIKAKGLIKNNRNIDTALAILEDIMKRNQDDEYKVYYLWGRYLKDKPADPNATGKVIASLESIAKKREIPDLFLFLGYLYKAIKNEERMIDAFKRLLKLEPNNTIASIEVKLYEKKKK